MARLVDADVLDNMLADAQSRCKRNGWNYRFGVLSTVRENIKTIPAVDAVPVEATAKRLQRAFFSDSWEAWAEWLRRNYSDEDFVAHVDRKKDAIPVEWLKELMLSTDDDVDKVELAWITREWQKEQEAR